jgi:hypothetical protein
MVIRAACVSVLYGVMWNPETLVPLFTKGMDKIAASAIQETVGNIGWWFRVIVPMTIGLGFGLINVPSPLANLANPPQPTPAPPAPPAH